MDRPDTDPRHRPGPGSLAVDKGERGLPPQELPLAAVSDQEATRQASGGAQDEAAWAGQFRDGDTEAFRRVIQAYQGRLIRLGLRMFGLQAEAEDFAQEALVRVYEKRRHYDARRPLAPWLFTVAVNLGRERLRRRREWPQGDDLPEGVQEPDGEQALLRAERRQLVWRALSLVPDPYRECLALRYEADLSLKDLARALGLPLGTVKSRLSRGLEYFQRQYHLLGGEAA
ncbi:MAG: sigma-70 family RNA polymerase sigma factor [candidate division FCPU426 bacterium]